jgi:YgiT-type zinc finger domain-containing protein
MEQQTIVALEIDTDEQPTARCENCGSSNIHVTRVRSAFWHQDRLVVVEDIPALVCDDCQERFYDDTTIVRLDLLRGDGFPCEKANSELRVPVFSLSGKPCA